MGILWFVAHVKLRREKKLIEYCTRQSLAATLPCYDAPHEYRGKTVVFRKPWFPGYVFLRIRRDQQPAIRQNEHVAKVLEVIDQETFQNQLDAILLALEAKLGLRLAPAIGQGTRVRVKRGPLQGLEGWVESRYGMTTVCFGSILSIRPPPLSLRQIILSSFSCKLSYLFIEEWFA